MENVQAFLLDDHELIRRGLRDLLDRASGIDVVGEAGSARDGITRMLALRPEVAVLDARLPDGSGIDVWREIRTRDPNVRALILTSYDDEALFTAILAGASGHVLKDVRGRSLVDAIKRVAAGESLLDPSVTARVLEHIRDGAKQPAELKQLSDPEKEVLTHIAEDQRADRRAHVSSREDGEDLRLRPAVQARDGAAYPGRRTRHQAAQRQMSGMGPAPA